MIRDDHFDNRLFFMVLAVASLGSIDVFSEILDQSIEVFSENWAKKVILFMSMYQATKSVRSASILSIILMLTFKDVFFNEKTTIRRPKPVIVLDKA